MSTDDQSMLQYRSMHDLALGVLRRIEELKLSVKPTSRLALGAARIAQAISQPQTNPDPDSLALLAAACRDFTLFEFILDDPHAGRSDPEFVRRLRIALKDGVRASRYARQTPGRDTQLELYVATVFLKASLPVAFGNPDVRTRLDGRFFYVEAKRPRTLNGIPDAVETAAHQIEATGCPGAIYMDVSLGMNPKELFLLRVIENGVFDEATEAAIKRAFQPFAPELDRMLRGTRVTDIVVQADWTRLVGAEDWSMNSHITRFANMHLASCDVPLRRCLFDAVRSGHSRKNEKFSLVNEANPSHRDTRAR